MSTRTRTKSAGVEFPQGENYGNRRSKAPCWSSPQPQGNQYYAGGKFETIPSLSDLPSPPRHWTDASARSQSTPSSPVTIATKPSAGISLDIGSLFGPVTPVSLAKKQGAGAISKSASLPQPGMMNMVGKKQGLLKKDMTPVFKTPENAKARPTVKVPTKPKLVKTVEKSIGAPLTPKPIPVTSIEGKATNGPTVGGKAEGITGRDLMEMLIRASPSQRQDFNATPAAKAPASVKLSPCHLQIASGATQYKEISEHLKSILNVSA